MDKARSRSKETRCTCITNLVKANIKKQHRPTGVGAQGKSRSKLKSIVIRAKEKVKFQSRDSPTGIETNATGHTRLEPPVKSRHHVARPHAKGHKKPKTEIEIEIKSQLRTTRVELRFVDSVEIRLKSKAGTFTIKV